MVCCCSRCGLELGADTDLVSVEVVTAAHVPADITSMPSRIRVGQHVPSRSTPLWVRPGPKSKLSEPGSIASMRQQSYMPPCVCPAVGGHTATLHTDEWSPAAYKRVVAVLIQAPSRASRGAEEKSNSSIKARINCSTVATHSSMKGLLFMPHQVN
ncbi:unnamed protein product [Protopolystoma xenopodis]|uniref:Uncharacterized protein n=1 Tax=Protopolystoma xenopodis TaxID=117903 RepID=A0A3S5AI12_9PLAT|nr:unnamed protein product [Protopolystoma xenopodis]